MLKTVTFRNIKSEVARAVLLSAVALGAMGAAQAATDVTTFKVKLTITESCLISATAPTDVDFGSQARTGAALTLDAAGALNVNCTSGTPYTIGLNGGANNTGTTATPTAGSRRMLSGTANYVGYELYQNTGRTTFWGNATGSWLGGTGTGASVSLPVYGRVVSANAPAGAYIDTVTATITY
ncbi:MULTISPECIES: Csu type fimbrial protein [Polaromonas]|uniref:Spore coat U domain-containing protein n=1 Tax=Polaromonas aquatica TaxID=332657 RepID=A0ABW1U0J1_9BURK